jgi:hypothetical protein
MYRHVSVVLAALALVVLIGCGKPPDTEKQTAEAAMQAAKSAEAEQYAPEAYRLAMDTLNVAQATKQEVDSKFALFRSYGKAKQLFLSAQALADSARAMAQVEKERVRAEVVEMMTTAQTAIDNATRALESAPRGKGSKADIEMIKLDLASVNAGFAEARADLNAEKFLVAKGKLEAVTAKAESIIKEIEAAKAKKMGR